jgi:hypothetical protein
LFRQHWAWCGLIIYSRIEKFEELTFSSYLALAISVVELQLPQYPKLEATSIGLQQEAESSPSELLIYILFA